MNLKIFITVSSLLNKGKLKIDITKIINYSEFYDSMIVMIESNFHQKLQETEN